MNTSTDEFFDARRSKYIKGFAITLMLFHHLFAFNDRIQNVNYISVGAIGVQTIENYIAIFARICVPIYLFVSGYGMYHYYKNKSEVKYKDLLKRILNILKIYWVILISFLVIGIFLDKQEFNLGEFIKNMLTISYSYNQEWWFLNTYIILVILFPFIKKIIDKTTNKNIVFIVATSFAITLVSGKLLSFNIISSDEILKMILNPIAYQSTFILGCMFCRLNIFDKLNDRIKNTYLNSIIIQISIITTCILLRGKYNIIDFIMVPLFIYASITCIEKLNLSNIFIYLGTYSTNMWLTHSFFCYYYFQNELFSFKYSLIIFILLIILSLISSYCINFILRYIDNFSRVLKNKKCKVVY